MGLVFSLVPIGLTRRDSGVAMSGDMPSIIHNKLPTWSPVIVIDAHGLLPYTPLDFVQKLNLEITVSST